jgi:hypothetical protein
MHLSDKPTTARGVTRPLIHRGASGNMAMFAGRFIQGRMEGFEKDMKICLTAANSDAGSGVTQANLNATMVSRPRRSKSSTHLCHFIVELIQSARILSKIVID